MVLIIWIKAVVLEAGFVSHRFVNKIKNIIRNKVIERLNSLGQINCPFSKSQLTLKLCLKMDVKCIFWSTFKLCFWYNGMKPILIHCTRAVTSIQCKEPILLHFRAITFRTKFYDYNIACLNPILIHYWKQSKYTYLGSGSRNILMHKRSRKKILGTSNRVSV